MLSTLERFALRFDEMTRRWSPTRGSSPEAQRLVLLAVLLCGSLGRASDADELDMFFGVAPAPPAPVPVTTYMVPDLPLPRQAEPELPTRSCPA